MLSPSAARQTVRQDAEPAAPPRMTIASIRSGRIDAPIRTLLHGVEGVGKTTFGANAPTPIFLGAEDGTGHLNVTRFPQPDKWIHVREAIATLTNEPHGFETLVIDTLDWAEPLLWAYICERDGKKNVEDYGYGKGYVAALDEWRVMIADLERLRAAKRMQIVMLAHSWIKPFKNPEGDDFDRYEMKINPKAAGLLKEWSDVVLFANYETFAHKDDRTKRVRGVSTGARVAYTTRSAAYDAKNRYDLPEQLPLDWTEYTAALKAGQVATPEALVAEITRKAAELGGDTEQKALALMAQHSGDASALAKINNRLNARLAEKANAGEVA
jgi:hypothetical protein